MSPRRPDALHPHRSQAAPGLQISLNFERSTPKRSDVRTLHVCRTVPRKTDTPIPRRDAAACNLGGLGPPELFLPAEPIRNVDRFLINIKPLHTERPAAEFFLWKHGDIRSMVGSRAGPL